jgi:hypothetical protein
MLQYHKTKEQSENAELIWLAWLLINDRGPCNYDERTRGAVQVAARFSWLAGSCII